MYIAKITVPKQSRNPSILRAELAFILAICNGTNREYWKKHPSVK